MIEGLFLSGAHVGLRKLRISDIEGGYGSWLNDLEVCRYNSHGRFPAAEDQLRKYVEGLDGRAADLVMAMIDLEDQKHIGNISLQNINYIDRSAEIGFVLGVFVYWGKGRAAEASRLLISHGFERLNLQRIYCGTSDDNIRMQHLAERLGFVQEGRRRRAVYNNGKYHDIIEYGLLKSEWRVV